MFLLNSALMSTHCLPSPVLCAQKQRPPPPTLGCSSACPRNGTLDEKRVRSQGDHGVSFRHVVFEVAWRYQVGRRGPG